MLTTHRSHGIRIQASTSLMGVPCVFYVPNEAQGLIAQTKKKGSIMSTKKRISGSALPNFRLTLVFVALGAFVFGQNIRAEEMPSFTTGLAKTVNPGLFACKGASARISAVGKIRAE